MATDCDANFPCDYQLSYSIREDQHETIHDAAAFLYVVRVSVRERATAMNLCFFFAYGGVGAVCVNDSAIAMASLRYCDVVDVWEIVSGAYNGGIQIDHGGVHDQILSCPCSETADFAVGVLPSGSGFATLSLAFAPVERLWNAPLCRDLETDAFLVLHLEGCKCRASVDFSVVVVIANLFDRTRILSNLAHHGLHLVLALVYSPVLAVLYV